MDVFVRVSHGQYVSFCCIDSLHIAICLFQYPRDLCVILHFHHHPVPSHALSIKGQAQQPRNRHTSLRASRRCIDKSAAHTFTPWCAIRRGKCVLHDHLRYIQLSCAQFPLGTTAVVYCMYKLTSRRSPESKQPESVPVAVSSSCSFAADRQIARRLYALEKQTHAHIMFRAGSAFQTV